MKTRKERREEARKNKVAFVPQYNGRQPQTYEEFFGIGYERFNDKFTTIKDVKKDA